MINRIFKSNNTYNRTFDETFRVWPKYFMDTSVFSLVCESFSGTLDQSGPYISEKSLYPLLNGHPMLAFAEQNFHSYLTDYGFELHNEIFDYTFLKHHLSIFIFLLFHEKSVQILRIQSKNAHFSVTDFSKMPQK